MSNNLINFVSQRRLKTFLDKLFGVFISKAEYSNNMTHYDNRHTCYYNPTNLDFSKNYVMLCEDITSPEDIANSVWTANYNNEVFEFSPEIISEFSWLENYQCYFCTFKTPLNYKIDDPDKLIELQCLVFPKPYQSITEPGIYITTENLSSYAIINSEIEFSIGELKQIDDKYIPDTIIRGSEKGSPNGIATLNNEGKINSDQMPDNEIYWSDVKDRPFYDARNIIDIKIPNDISDIPKLYSRPCEELENGRITFIKMSDDYIAPNDILGATIDYNTGSGGVRNFAIEDKYIFVCDTGFYVAYVDSEGDMMFPVCLSIHTNGVLEMMDGLVVFDVEPGLYFLYDEELITETVNYFEKTSGELKTLDIKYLPENMALGYETKHFDDIIWDGNTDGLLTATYSVDGESISWYRVSEKFIPQDDMIGATYYTTPTMSPDENGTTYTFEVPTFINNNGSFTSEVYFVSVSEPNTMIDMYGMEVVFPDEGIWFVGLDTEYGFGYVANLISHGELVQLDEKFIPDTIARKSDLYDINLSNYYTKEETYSRSEVDAAIENIDELNNYYTKPEIDEEVSNVNLALDNRYTKQETEHVLSNYVTLTSLSNALIPYLIIHQADEAYAKKANVYTKDEVDNQFALFDAALSNVVGSGVLS